MTHPYGAASYARHLAHVGEPFAVPEWSGHVLVRPTPDGGRWDATGVYPLTVLPPQADLEGGIERLRAAGLVSVVLVAADRLRPDLGALEAAFDLVRPFKSHFLHDRALGPPAYSKHHRHEIRRALRLVEVSEIALADHLRAWLRLYGGLVSRHGLGGLHAFPEAHHRGLAHLEGARTFGGFIDGELVAAHIFVTHRGHAISHLAASSAAGYASGAAYAVNDLALKALTDCEVVNLGGGAGLAADPADGLVRFKKGFANTAAPAYLCARILDRPAYDALSTAFEPGAFFPAYRGPGRR